MKFLCLLCLVCFCASTQADLKAFDCGSSGTKWNGKSATPTMTDACTGATGQCVSASTCNAKKIDNKQNCEDEQCGYEFAKDWVTPNSECFAAATAGNRIVNKQKDLKSWNNFRGFFNDCKTWKGVKNMVFVQPNSQTLPGTGEAFFEAYFTKAKGKTGFFSAGGASAQYGFKMCSQPVVTAWSAYVNAIKDTHKTTQCTDGTEDKLEAFVATTCDTKLSELDMEDVKKSYDGHVGTDFISTGSEKFSPGAVGNWALGSLLIGPSCGTAKIAGMNQIWDNFEAENNACASATTKAVGCNYDTVKAYVAQDPVLPKLATFIKKYTDECDTDHSKTMWPAGMKFSRKEESDLATDRAFGPGFHGDWAPMITNAIADVLGCKASKAVIDNQQNDDPADPAYPKYHELTFGWLDDLVKAPHVDKITEVLTFTSDTSSDLERLEDDLDALKATINQLEA